MHMHSMYDLPDGLESGFTYPLNGHRKQPREILSIPRLAAIRKLERLDYMLTSASGPVVSRIMNVTSVVTDPEERVRAATFVLEGEVTAGRETDFVRACLGTLRHDDERELEGESRGNLKGENGNQSAT